MNAASAMSASRSPARRSSAVRLTARCLLLFTLLCPLPAQSFAKSANRDKDGPDEYRDLEMFANVLNLVQQNYVDDTEMQKLVRGAVEGMLGSLDPHSSYLTPDEYQELEEETTGSFSGVGIEVTLKDEVLTVVAPIDGTPADRLGIKPGDQILRIDGQPTKNMSLMDAMKKMRGNKGTAVTLAIHRASWRGTRDFTLVREEIPLVSVKASELEPGYGYIRISNFQESTTEDMLNALERLRTRHPIKGLALDLRNNPGGLLDQAIKVADLFLDHGVIVSTRGRANQEQLLYEAHPDARAENYPMVVLINGGSASGAEIVAGALRDHKRAKVLGTTSFGKGSVQTIVPLPDGSAIRLTTARYYTPSGTSIQAKGILPDIVAPLEAQPGMADDVQGTPALREKDLPGHLVNDAERGKEADTASAMKNEGNQEEAFQRVNSILDIKKRLKEDSQLRRALEMLKNE